MKRKPTLINCLLVFMLILIVASCKKDVANNVLNTPEKLPADSNFISMDMATLAATTVPATTVSDKLFKKQSVNSVTSTTTKKIADVTAIPDNTNPSYYIFNYENGGYVIVAADKRVSPILAISDQGYFPKSGQLPEGLINWLAVSHKKMQQVRSNKGLTAPKNVRKLWVDLLPVSKKGGSKQSVNKLLPIEGPCQDTYTSTTVGPLLQTQWGQGYPYNALCPFGNYSGGHVPTGCVATSISQILYYWKAPSNSYSWASMPLDYTDNGNTELARLMHDVGLAAGMNYNDSGSGSSAKAGNVLRNSFHYSSASDADYNYQTVYNNIDSHWPVVLSAATDKSSFLFWTSYSGGHMWVCDGYMEGTYSICATPDSPAMGGGTLLLHMNWGWNENWVTNNSNGYYYFDSWSVLNGSQTENFQYSKTMTYNIHP